MATHLRRYVVIANLIYAMVLLLLGVSSDIPAAASFVPDHTAHAFASAAHAALLFALFRASFGLRVAAILAATCASLYGGFIEALQLMQPARSAEAADLAANTIGACATALAIYLVAGRAAKGVDS